MLRQGYIQTYVLSLKVAYLQVFGAQRVSVCDAEHDEGGVVCVGRYATPC